MSRPSATLRQAPSQDIRPMMSYASGESAWTIGGGLQNARSPSTSVSYPANGGEPAPNPLAPVPPPNPRSGQSFSSIAQGRRQRRTTTEDLENKLPPFMRVNTSTALVIQRENMSPRTDANGLGHISERTAAGDGSGDTWYSPTAHTEWHLQKTLERRLAIKNLIIAAVSEFCGTFFFLFFALAINTTCSVVKAQETEANGGRMSVVDLQALLVSSLGFGFSLAISAWVFFRISGGVQNPAITLALTLTGALTWPKFVVLSIAQYAAGLAAAALVSGLYPTTVDSRTTLGEGVTVNQGFWLEFFMSAQLIFTVLMLAAEKHKGTYLAPVGIGLALFITQLLGQPYTGASVNPARTLGPDVVQRTFNGYCWIYYAASYAAALVTSFFFLALKWVRYETATPDQDADLDGVHHQLITDMRGNVIAKMDTVPADEFEPIETAHEKQVRQVTTDLKLNAQADARGQAPPAGLEPYGTRDPPSAFSSPQTTPVVGSNGGLLPPEQPLYGITPALPSHYNFQTYTPFVTRDSAIGHSSTASVNAYMPSRIP